MESLTRRAFVGGVATGSCLASQLGSAWAHAKPRRPRVAAIFTELRFRSHAYNFLENFLGPYLFNGKLTDPGVDVVSFYADQFPENDLARGVSKQFNIPIYKTIGEAMCGGGDRLAVDAVLSIGEHGDYPFNARGQKMYPRKRFFDEATAVMQREGRFLPLFNDKHWSYRWDWAKQMVDYGRRHSMPLLAGSSVPLAERRTASMLPPAPEFVEAVAVHGGGRETYDFHGLEVLQSFVETRPGGETGIARVEMLAGENLKQAIADQRIPVELVRAAMAAERRIGDERQTRPDRDQRPRPKQDFPAFGEPPITHAVLLTYADGLRAAVVKVGYTSNRWNFACRLRGENQPRGIALFNGPWGNRCLFKALSHAVQHLFVTGREPYPAERTLLTTGALDAAMRSLDVAGKPVATPELAIRYDAVDCAAMRESGATWKRITKHVAQPRDFRPGFDRQFSTG